MRIGVDACCWTNGRGYGRFTRELLRHMVAQAPDDEFVCFLDGGAAAVFDLEAPNVRPVAVRMTASPTAAASANGYRSPMDMLRLTLAVARERIDVFFSPSVYTYFPLPPGLPAVVTVHDTIAERHPGLTLGSRRARLFWNAKVRLALHQARLILTVSDFAAREIEEVLKVEPRRLRVATEAPATEYHPSHDQVVIRGVAERAGVPLDARYFTYVGGFNPHKRLDVLVQAHRDLVDRRPSEPPHLVLVGNAAADVFHQSVEQIRSAIHRAGTTALVHWAGYVSDVDLRHLHSGAIALVLPSENEGFGLPAVEAAACGTPVIATQNSPLPELLADGGMFVQPGEVAELSSMMETMMTDENARRRMGQQALLRAGHLSWRRSADAALSALREAAA